VSRTTGTGLVVVAGGSLAIAIGSIAGGDRPATVPVLAGFALVVLGLWLIARQRPGGAR